MVAHPALACTILDDGVEGGGVEAVFYAHGEGFGGREEDRAGEVVVGDFGG